MRTFNKTLLATALTAIIGTTAATNAMAVAFPDFTVQEGVVAGSVNNSFTADKITGNYVEVITFDVANGTYDVSLKWNAGQFVANDGTDPQSTQLGGFGAAGYGMYALYQSSGTFATVAGVTTFTNSPIGTLQLFIDPNKNTTFTAPVTGDLLWTTGNTGDDQEVAFGTPGAGEGTLDPTLSTCGSKGINCGSFGTSASFELTAFGSTYFTAPVPFYNISFQSGQLNNFDVSGTQTINGSLDVTFEAPEPASLALFGLGLLGLGFTSFSSRKQNKA